VAVNLFFCIAQALLGLAHAAPSSSYVVASSTIVYFDTKAAAQTYCSRDVVVWLNIPTGIYHYKVSGGTGARNMARTYARSGLLQRVIAQAKMGNSLPSLIRGV
jgi:hypothetical protein